MNIFTDRFLRASKSNINVAYEDTFKSHKHGQNPHTHSVDAWLTYTGTQGTVVDNRTVGEVINKATKGNVDNKNVTGTAKGQETRTGIPNHHHIVGQPTSGIGYVGGGWGVTIPGTPTLGGFWSDGWDHFDWNEIEYFDGKGKDSSVSGKLVSTSTSGNLVDGATAGRLNDPYVTTHVIDNHSWGNANDGGGDDTHYAGDGETAPKHVRVRYLIRVNR